jgi:hypothetical protein
MQEGGLTMTTITTIVLPVADSWTVSVGGGWIVVMLIGMGLCFVGMFAFMWLMRGGQGWPMCGWRRPQETALRFGEPRFGEGTVPLDDSHQRRDVRVGTTVRNSGPGVSSRESEAPR